MSDAKIMLVDESRFFLELEQQYLGDSRVEVVALDSFGEVLARLRSWRPDLIYLDIGAPGMHGVATCRELKAHPCWSAIPVVMLCSQSQPDEKSLCYEAGCQGVLSKPLERAAFLSMGRRFLPGIERRSLRVLCSTTVFFHAAGKHHYAASMDISEGGMFLETDYPCEVGEFLDLGFNLPGDARQVIEVRGRVVWLNRADKLLRPSYPAGAGIEFINLTPTAAKMIRHYVEEKAPLQDRVGSRLQLVRGGRADPPELRGEPGA